MKKVYRKVFLTALIIFLLDRFSKYLIISNFKLNESLQIVSNVFHLTYVSNTGIAFGFLKNSAFLLTLIAIFVLTYSIYYATKLKENETWLQAAMGLLIGGIFGNLFDRMIYGYVIDFLDFRIWPVFNIADSSITISAVILVILLWKK